MPRALSIISVVAFFAPAALANTDVAFDDVPQSVLDTALNTAPGVQFDRVSIEIENGVSIYEFEGEDHNGRHIEIDVTEDGVLEEIEMEIAMSDVPATVLATLEREAPGFRADYVELSVREGGALFIYEFEGAVGGERVSLEIAESGALVSHSDGYSS